MKKKKYTINNQDVLKWADGYDGENFHALLTDAPYHLTTITKRFGKNGSAPAKFGKDGAFQRASKGFMGQDWDGGDISFRPETWAALGEHLYPGAFGMTFGGSRTAHRIAVAIEDAGFIIHPMIVWVYGSGFPKATRVKGHKEFDGHRYGMQALKPAAEPIIVFQKPYDGKPVDNIVGSGAGALNIDAGRIASESYTINTWDDNAHPFGNGAGNKFTGRQVSGRWPANFVMDAEVAPVLDAQSGHLKSGKFTNKTIINSDWGYTGGKRSPLPLSNTIGDEGGASRYFYNVQTQLDNADPFFYAKKASGKERNAGLMGMPKKITNPNYGKGGFKRPTGEPEREISASPNFHPTVKPLDLCRYLASLLLPPIGYAPRRILVPFSGSGSEMIGCLLAGWEYAEGIELGKEYTKIAEKRLKHWVK